VADQVVARWEPTLKVFEANQWTASNSKDVRYVGIPGMNAPAKQLAKDLTIHAGQTIDALKHQEGKWFLHSAESGDIATKFDELFLAIPGPQALSLVRELDPAAKAIAERSDMKGCWTLMARFKDKVNVPFDAAFVNQEIISWICRNLSKPKRTGKESWTIHANAEWSQEFIELSKEDATEKILACAKKLGLDCAEAEVSVHRWRYASGAASPALAFYLNHELKLGLCGDWLHGGRVEGAWLSGHLLASTVGS
jgi:predicted NAD/FAD-dependent oxidoreductase